MASFTAHIISGNGGGYDNEGIIPIDTLYLSENSRPAWVLKKGANKITWIPTVDNMLEDGLLMLALHAIKHPEIVALADQYFNNPKPTWAELYQDITEEHLQALYQKNRSIKWCCKLIITVFDKSHIRSQIPVLEQYNNENIEVCTPIFTRNYSRWSGKVITKGSLN